MCIAILKPKNKYLDKKILQTCSDNNKDGCGFAYINNGKIYIKKYLLFEDFFLKFLVAYLHYQVSFHIL